MADLTVQIRKILSSSKTTEGVYFSNITGHVRVAVDNFETNEVAQFIVTGFCEEGDDVAPVWLHKYTFGWIFGLDSGDQYLILN